MAEPRPIAEFAGNDHRVWPAIRAAGRPAIVRGLYRAWPAVEAAKQSAAALVAYCKRFSHPAPVPAIVGGPEIAGRFFYTDDLSGLNFTRGQSALDPFMDRLLRDADAPHPYAMAIQSAPVDDVLPGFSTDNPIDLPGIDARARLWMGNAIRVATHFDLKENIGVVVGGRRRFTVFAPDQLPNLYMGPFDLTPAGAPVSLVDPANPDLVRYPRFGEALRHAWQGELGPGDAIYIPYHWWHAVDSLDPVNLFINVWWDPAPAGLINPHDALLAAIGAYAGLRADQRAAWRVMFDWLVFREAGDPAAHIPPAARGVLDAIGPEHGATIRQMLIDRLRRD